MPQSYQNHFGSNPVGGLSLGFMEGSLRFIIQFWYTKLGLEGFHVPILWIWALVLPVSG